MADFRRRTTRDLRHPMARWRQRSGKIVCIVLLALAVAGFVLFGMAQNRLSNIRSELRRSIQGHLDQALTAYDGIDLRSANVEGEILPAMLEHFYRAQALDDAMVSLFGAKHEMFPDSIHENFLETMSEYKRAAKTGQSTSTAREMLDGCVTELRDRMTTHFDARGNLIQIEP